MSESWVKIVYVIQVLDVDNLITRVLNNILKDNLKQDQVLNDTIANNKQEIFSQYFHKDIDQHEIEIKETYSAYPLNN